MFFFIHWGAEAGHKDIGNNHVYCENCQRVNKQTYRLYEDKFKLYWFITLNTKKVVTSICHNCLSESRLSLDNEEKIIKSYESLTKLKKVKEQ